MTRQQILSRAQNAVATALGRGTLKVQPCEGCGQEDNRNSASGKTIQAHHDDYSQPLNVRWLCGSCHKQHHLKHGPGLLPADFAEERRAA